MKVLVNRCYGGFGFSEEFQKRIKSLNIDMTHTWRSNSILIEEVLKFGLEKAAGEYAKLAIEEIPDDVCYSIGEYDGQEWIDQIWIEVTLDELKSGLTQENLDIISKGVDIKLKH